MRLLTLGVLMGALLFSAALLTSGPVDRAAAGPPSVGLVAIDVEPGNPSPHTCNSVTAVTDSLGNVQLNTPFDVDIIGEAVPPTSGIGLDFGFDPALIQVNAVIATPGIASILPPHNLFFCDNASSAVPFGPVTSNPNPGVFRVDVTDIGGDDETGSGRLLTLQLECIGTGTSALTMSDTLTGGGNKMGVLGPQAAFAYPVSVEEEALIGCGEPVSVPATPTPTLPPTTGSPTQTPTPTPTPTPMTGSPTPTATVTGTPTPTAPPAGTGAATATPTTAPTAGPSATPGALPPTGGFGSSGGVSTALLVLAIGAALILATAGGVIVSQSARRD